MLAARTERHFLRLCEKCCIVLMFILSVVNVLTETTEQFMLDSFCDLSENENIFFIFVGDSLLRHVFEDLVKECNLNLLDTKSINSFADLKHGLSVYTRHEKKNQRFAFIFVPGIFQIKEILTSNELSRLNRLYGRNRAEHLVRSVGGKFALPFTQRIEKRQQSVFNISLFTPYLKKGENFSNSTLVFGSAVWDLIYGNNLERYESDLQHALRDITSVYDGKIFFRLAPIFCPEKGLVWKRLKRLHREVNDGIDKYNDVAIYTVKSKNKLNKNIIHILDHSSPTYGQSCDGDGMHFQNNHRVRRELLYRTCKALCGNSCEKRYHSKLEGIKS